LAKVSCNIEGGDSLVNCGIEDFRISKGLMCEMMDFEIAPDAFDIIEFRRIFRQPLDGGAGPL
jgi:hypothetical protein